MAKYTDIVCLLERRIKRGYYVLHEFPPETSLSEEVGVARVTVRKAIAQLISQGLLTRKPNGRVALDRSSPQTKPQLAFLAPAYINSNDANLCQSAARNAATAAGANLQLVEYAQWDDPSIVNALRSFDGIFFKPWTEATPPQVIDALRASGRPVVAFDQDLTAFGIRSFCPFPPVFVQRLLDHCAGLGHRQIDCLNTQPVDPVIEQRIAQWRIWLTAHGLTGTLHSVASTQPFQQGYELMQSLLVAERFKASAVLCTTGPAAIGAMRALHEKQLRIGTDVSVCAVNDEGLGRYLVPSLTAIEMPDLVPQLILCAQWMIRGGSDWIGPLLMQPAAAPLFVGESVGPVREVCRVSGGN
jgi:DNA-binding LacI/PurR family transcriptional regulator